MGVACESPADNSRIALRMSREWWHVKQKSIGSVSPHAWQLPVLLNLWLTVITAALAIAVHKRTENGTCEFVLY